MVGTMITGIEHNLVLMMLSRMLVDSALNSS